MSEIHVGTGTTIAAATGFATFFAEILDVTPPNASLEAIQTSHMGTTVAHTFTPADLIDWGELNCQLAFDPAEDPPMGTVATFTITFPDDDTTTWQFSGFITGYEPSVPMEDRATADVTIKVSGDVTVT